MEECLENKKELRKSYKELRKINPKLPKIKKNEIPIPIFPFMFFMSWDLIKIYEGDKNP